MVINMKKKATNIKDISKLFIFTKRKIPAYLLTLLISAGANAAFAIIMAFVNKELLNTVTSGEMTLLSRIVIPAIIAFILICIIFPLFIYLKVVIIRDSVNQLKEKIYRHIIKLPMKSFQTISSGDILSRITGDIGIISNALDNQMQMVVYSLLSGIGSVFSMLVLDWRLFLFCLALGLISAWVNTRFAPIFRKLNEQIRIKIAKLTQVLHEFMRGIQTIKLYGLYEQKQSEYLLHADSLRKTQIESAKKNAQLDSVNYLLQSANTLGLFVIGAIMVSKGYLDFGVVAGIMTLQGGLNQMLQNFGNIYTQLQESIAGAERVYEILSLPVESDRLNVPCDGAPLGGAVDIEHVTFSYKEENHSTLHDISFSIPNLKTIALVGPSGGGKSTIIKLLLGLYEFNQGAIFVNGCSINKYSLWELRDKISYVSQNPVLFSGSIYDNIAYCRKDVSKKQVIAAAKAAMAHSFIMDLPDQYDTDVGEAGAKLSGGQKQRICIARAILKNAPIIIFDEATSALDSENEKQICETISKLKKEKTCIVIAHRLKTVEDTDIILYLSEGKIVEMGTHQELMFRNGEYAMLYYSQYN